VPYNYTGWKDNSATSCGDKIITLGKDAVPRLMQSCTWMDTLVGDVVQALEDRGLRENTIIIYTTDNGAALTRGKASFYEDGMRTPIILNSAAPAGSPWYIPARGLHHAMVGVIDILPTILDYAREGQSSIPSWVPDPSDETRFPDALSLRSVVDGTTNDLRTLLFSNRDPGSDKSVREAIYTSGTDTLTSLYKLYVSKAGVTKQLFDLLANPFENPKLNLVKDPAQAARVAALKAAIAAW
jgi:arylsulfatase A-like enzyme